MIKLRIFSVIFCTILPAICHTAKNESGSILSENITKILDTLLRNYDKRLRPNYGGQPVQIDVTLHIAMITAVSEVDMDYTVELYLRQYWMDPRLSFQGSNKTLTVSIEMINNIWNPDTFFPNEKKSIFHTSTTDNTFIRISPNGEILRSTRLTITANCPMALEFFPMDRQNCSLEVESYGYLAKDIFYKWKTAESSVSIAKEINLAQFSLIGTPKVIERQIELTTGDYSRLSVYFDFQRNIGFYLIQIYLPSSLIVVISWVSFWLNREATQARVAIGVTTVLTMTTLMTSTNSSLPKVSYVKAIDIYLGTCFIIVFASLLEYAAVGYLLKRRKERTENGCRSGQAKKATKGRYSYAAAIHYCTENGEKYPNISKKGKNGKNGPFLSRPARPKSLHGLKGKNRVSSPTLFVAKKNQPSPESSPNSTTELNWLPTTYYSIVPPIYEKTRKTKPSVARKDLLKHDTDVEFSSLLNTKVSPRSSELHQIDQIHDSDQFLPEKSNNFIFCRILRKSAQICWSFNPSLIDKYSRIAFPLVFLIFHTIYWLFYLGRS